MTAPARRAVFAAFLGLSVSFGLTACGPATPTAGIVDPNEGYNRGIHKFNLAVVKNVVRPLANSATKIIPPQVREGVDNFAGNLELPGRVVNNVLQLRFGKAIENTTRFAINTTLGIGGLFDPATAVGVEGKDTDFGETLYVWGVTEGNYAELPFIGPSTDRDALGKAIDIALDPVKLLWPDSDNIRLFAKLGSGLSARGRYTQTLDSILYESADSYAQARLLYLDNRRFNLGQTPSEDTFEDPYAQ